MSPQQSIASLFDIAARGVQAEDLVLRNLLLGRAGYGEYSPGIATAFETGTVYVIFKSLLASPFSLRHEVHWENSIDGRPIDLTFGPLKPATWQAGLEVKWWGKGGSGIAGDAKKLLAVNSLQHRLLLVLHAWATQTNAWTLEELIQRSSDSGWISDYNTNIVHYREFETCLADSIPATLGLALLSV